MNRSILIILLVLPFVALAVENEIDCGNAMTTMDINHCAYIELESAQAELLRYLEASFEHNSDDPELIDAIKLAQQHWQAYKTSHCDSIYTQWRDGTIRGVMAISCETRLTQQRTHEIWSNFLTYMDSTEPVLPEPRVSLLEDRNSTLILSLPVIKTNLLTKILGKEGLVRLGLIKTTNSFKFGFSVE